MGEKHPALRALSCRVISRQNLTLQIAYFLLRRGAVAAALALPESYFFP
jgi:hypothetical protein